ncbi:hypothetical protein [Gaetbulibacter sp. PBL-D1]|uniref:hypothetical protein n=1 Tax=Gaetbulibacter sp. PBL-D1 TaxID=3422594 RepID=UPI003D2F1099
MKKTTYIQFKVPKNEHTSEPDGAVKRNIKKAIIGILSSIIPKGNPDFENKIGLVETWIVEFENETEIPEREIGMDKDGRIIVKMPFKNNYGYWTDNNLLLPDFKKHFETTEISQDSFENYWSLFEKTEDFETELTEFKTQSTGADGGHKYLKSKVDYKGQNREIVIYFTNKSDEQKITELNKIKIRGKIVDDGIEQSLTLYETKLLNE